MNNGTLLSHKVLRGKYIKINISFRKHESNKLIKINISMKEKHFTLLHNSSLQKYNVRLHFLF